MKRTILSDIVLIAAGAAIGSAVTWHLLKTKYEQLAQAEIEDMKEYYSRKGVREPVEEDEDNKVSEATIENPDSKTPSVREYAEKLQEQGYTNYSDMEKKREADDVKKPYVISPDEYGEKDDYETYSLTLYADNVLTDEQDMPIEDVDNTVGCESLTTFGEYEEDSVFVRNDRLKIDYEILRMEVEYSEVIKSIPHPAEDE